MDQVSCNLKLLFDAHKSPVCSLTILLQVLYLFLVESMNTGCDVYIIYQPLIERFG